MSLVRAVRLDVDAATEWFAAEPGQQAAELLRSVEWLGIPFVLQATGIITSGGWLGVPLIVRARAGSLIVGLADRCLQCHGTGVVPYVHHGMHTCGTCGGRRFV
jgi:hypothetical protein